MQDLFLYKNSIHNVEWLYLSRLIYLFKLGTSLAIPIAGTFQTFNLEKQTCSK